MSDPHNVMMLRPTKRQRLENPPSWMDCASLAVVPSARGYLHKTSMSSTLTRELFFGRFKKEIVDRFQYSLGKKQPLVSQVSSPFDVNQENAVLQQRVVVGINACTKVLHISQTSKRPPLLVVVCDTTLATHLPIMAAASHCPIFLLPADAQIQMGQLLGIRRASTLILTRHDASEQQTPMSPCDKDVHDAVDSFAEFVRNKLLAGGDVAVTT
jgi:hypothetical protein